jgi:hypothetical protein
LNLVYADGDYGRNPNGVRKIIATTDPKLIEGEWVGDKDDFQDFKEGVLNIPQSFIEEYCKAGGIDEVLVECDYPIKEWDKNDVPGLDNKVWITKLEPKLNPDNTIIIQMYSREEVGSKIKEFVKEYAYEWDMDDINEWIEENL